MSRKKRDATRQWNSRQRKKFIENHTVRRHQRQSHENIEKQHLHARRFAQLFGFPCRSHAMISWSIRVSKPDWLTKNTGCQNELAHFEKKKKTNEIPPSPWRAFVRKIPLAPVLLYKLALYESCLGRSATPQGNEIRGSEESWLKISPSDVTSVNISWKYRKTAFACTEVSTTFRLPLSVVCFDFSIYECIWNRFIYKKYKLSKRTSTF